MATPTSFSKSSQTFTFAMVGILAALAAYLCVQQLRTQDRDIFARLTIAFGENDAQLQLARNAGNAAVDWSGAGGILNLAGFALFAVAAAFIVIRLSGVPRLMASTSLFVLSMLYQWCCWSLLHTPMHPVGFVAALLPGVAGGLYLRSKEDRRREYESHYFELKLKNQELLDTRLTLLKQDEIERRTLAADLHDQVLNDLKQVVQRFEKYVAEPDVENEQAIRNMTSQVMREIREVMDSLSPSVLEHLGLSAAVEDCLRRGSERAGFKVRFRSKVDMSDLECLSMVEQALLYRLIQESITNICKHAQATTVRATLELSADDALIVRIVDNGKGIDPAKMRGDSRGLRYMRYRADLIGCTISWGAGDDSKGTAVEIRLDLADRRLKTAAQKTTAQPEQGI